LNPDERKYTLHSISGAIIDTSDPRAVCYYVTIAVTIAGILISAILLKESKTFSVRPDSTNLYNYSVRRKLTDSYREKLTFLMWPLQLCTVDPAP